MSVKSVILGAGDDGLQYVTIHTDGYQYFSTGYSTNNGAAGTAGYGDKFITTGNGNNTKYVLKWSGESSTPSVYMPWGDTVPLFASDKQGNFIIRETGLSPGTLSKYSFSSNMTTNLKISGTAHNYDYRGADQICIASDGSMLISDDLYAGSTDQRAYMVALNADGTKRWSRLYGNSNGFSSGYATRLTFADNSSNLYAILGGNNGGQEMLMVTKFDSTGTALWMKYFGNSAYDYITPSVITTDSVGNFYVGIRARNPSGGNSYARILKIDPTFSTILWQSDKEWQTTWGAIVQIQVASNGDVYVGIDEDGSSIQLISKFNSSGIYQSSFGITSEGSGSNGQLICGFHLDESTNMFYISSTYHYNSIYYALTARVKSGTSGRYIVPNVNGVDIPVNIGTYSPWQLTTATNTYSLNTYTTYQGSTSYSPTITQASGSLSSSSLSYVKPIYM